MRLTNIEVPVYELKLHGDHVMRRRSDDWINATHILKIAGFDKPARTRILEREVQKGVHEKIQGGYGKYQGTWVPLEEGRQLADKNGVFQKIHKIFEYVQGDKSPPPAPKHQLATAARNKASKAQPQARRSQANHQPVHQPSHQPNHGYYRQSDDQYEELSTQHGETPIEQTPPSSPLLDSEQLYQFSQTSTGGSRKRRRVHDSYASDRMTLEDKEHTLYGDELLDYFVTSGEEIHPGRNHPPAPPASFNPNRRIDDQGNYALHWACAMGDLQVTRDLLNRGANPAIPTELSGETPLIRAVLFTNNYDRKTFPKIVNFLGNTIGERDIHGATVFHHIAETARSKTKWGCAKYYCEVLINKLQEYAPSHILNILSTQDKNGDTAVLCAVRNGCIKVATFLLTHCAEAGDITNLKGETANDLLRHLSSKRQSLEVPPSSPVQPGESFGKRHKRVSDLSKIQPKSRAGKTVIATIGPAVEEHLAIMAKSYDDGMNDLDTSIRELNSQYEIIEAQRRKVRQETYALMAKAESTGTNQDENDAQSQELRNLYAAKLREHESLLEQVEHTTLQASIRAQDSTISPHLFRVNNPNPLTHDEMRAALPVAVELSREQAKRREHVKNVAFLMGNTGAKENIDMYRTLVSIATGVPETELDGMSKEILESLEASNGDGEIAGIKTPEGGSGQMPLDFNV
ncbi:putative apses transcription [Phaeomoniella chlamydospora]|uniref:Cell pattern formation-associated protein stuA n=1 Tax=Phaeomoniella chlamydospora TaxID=158046 RepID=A0A0G2H923_PHACM|nr:putative apses transcription [Phaeomoniella chlamydospora]